MNTYAPSDLTSTKALTVQDFATADDGLREAFPLAWDATTMKGLAALMMALPSDWPDALAMAYTHFKKNNAETGLDAVFLRGTPRTLPQHRTDITRVRTRRSALKRLQVILPDLSLGSINSENLHALVALYRNKQSNLPAPMLSADISELRFTLDFALSEADLPTLKHPSFDARPRQRLGRPSQRPIATLAEVKRLLCRAETWMQAFIALTLAVPAPQKYLMSLCREDIDLQRSCIRMNTPTTRSASGQPGRMAYGLPVWCIQSLYTAFPYIEKWNYKQLLFPSHADPQSLRGDVSHVFRTLARKSDCIGITLSDIRRLSQAIHIKAPRAVRRGTATSRLDTSGPDPLAIAQEHYASLIIEKWKIFDQPPWPPGRISRRALKYLNAEDSEDRTDI